MFEEILEKAKKIEIDAPYVDDISFKAECETPNAKEKEVKQTFGQILF